MNNYLIILLLFLSVGFSQQKKTDEPNPMKGIKTKTTSQYDFKKKFDEFEGTLIGKKIYKYDSKGNKIEESYYDSGGNLSEDYGIKMGISTIIYKYDSKGNKIEES